MAKIYLVRHGQAASGWGLEIDPGLDDLGRIQAMDAAQKMAPLGPLPIISSPMARAQETAAPLAEIWKTRPTIDERLGEIVFPSETPADRIQWLKEVMTAQWSDLDENLRDWRRQVIEALISLESDTVVFSHYIAINAAVGRAARDERVEYFKPNNASITVLETDRGKLRLADLGEQADTRVN